MEIVYDQHSLDRYMTEAVEASPEHPILIDKFLEDAVEVDVDAVCDGVRTIVGGVMEHIEEAGIHSGDSACAIPPFSLPESIVAELKTQTYALAQALEVRGLMNIQFAVKEGEVYVLEVNPRASRTVPFVSKATGLNLAQAAARVMVGRSLENQGVTTEPIPRYVSVKEAVFPFAKFPGVDIVLGPEMRSTGEVMGIDTDFASAFAKSQLAAQSRLPSRGTVFVSVAERDRQAVVPISRRLSTMGFRLLGTSGTVGTLLQHGIDVTTIRKIREGRPNLLDHLANGTIDLIVNTPSGKGARTDEGRIRASAVSHGVPCITTIAGALRRRCGHGTTQRRKAECLRASRPPLERWRSPDRLNPPQATRLQHMVRRVSPVGLQPVPSSHRGGVSKRVVIEDWLSGTSRPGMPASATTSARNPRVDSPVRRAGQPPVNLNRRWDRALLLQ